MKLSALLAPLLDAKADHEMIRQMIVAYEQEQADALDHRRKADAERQARKREREKSRDVTLRHSDRVLAGAGDARVEDNNSKPKIEPLEEKQTAQARGGADLAAFKAELSPHVDAERIEAYVKHRRSKRGQNTAYAARLFLGDAEACGLSVRDAIDTCISRNWITVKPEFLKGRNGTGPPTKAETPLDVSNRILAEMRSASEQSRTHPDGHKPAVVAIPSWKHTGTG